MDAPAAARFADACGAAAPLDLLVEKDDGTVVAKGVIDQPFAVVGRDPACDVCLADGLVGPKHAYLQVIGGRVFVTDLGSPTGIEFADGRRPCGWLRPDDPVRIGRFRLFLAAPVSDNPTLFGPTFHPFAAGPDVPTTLPAVEIEFRNGRASRSFWSVNRVLTLVGRARDCKLSLAGDDISQFHCCLVLAADGLWAVDLLGRGGMRVNGQLVRHRRLNHNDELKVGRFVLGCVYPKSPGDTSFVSFELPKRPAVAREPSLAELTDALHSDPAGGSPQVSMDGGRSTDFGPIALPPHPTHPAAAPPDGGTELDLDLFPTHGHLVDSAPDLYPLTPPPKAGMPGLSPTDGEVSLPPLPLRPEDLPGVTGFPAPPAETPPTGEGELLIPPDMPLADPLPPAVEPPPAALVPTEPSLILPAGGFEESVVPLLKQLGEMQGQMFAQFQQSLMMMMQMFGQMHREQMGAVQQELDRMAELNGELQKLQAEMAKANPPDPPPAPASRLPDPESVPAVSAETAALHNAVWEKMAALDQERQSIWQRLSGLVTKPGP